MSHIARALRVFSLACLAVVPQISAVDAQTVTHRGFVEGRGWLFPSNTANDTEVVVGDLLAREEVFIKPAPWIQFAAGIDGRANGHEQVQRSWRLDLDDRGTLRPALTLRRATATIVRGALTVDLGKQFVRWGKTDIVAPTDRFAPRDFLNVVDNEFLAVLGARGVLELGNDSLDVVWLPRFTPSRVPLLTQRWTAVPEGASFVTLVDAGAVLPDADQTGVRWSRTGIGHEFSLSFVDGFNHAPNLDVASPQVAGDGSPPSGVGGPVVPILRRYPELRMFGADAALQTAWASLKSEVAYFTTSTAATDEYALFVVQLERQTGEWLLVGGYAGEIVTRRRATASFAPDRGLSRSVVGRASYTFDTNRSGAFEFAIRQNGGGVYAKGELSQARGDHWRATATAVLLAGKADDFLGQYRRNSHVTLTLRYSF
jgi:hypothetical protein